jgi:hypothetical protein
MGRVRRGVSGRCRRGGRGRHAGGEGGRWRRWRHAGADELAQLPSLSNVVAPVTHLRECRRGHLRLSRSGLSARGFGTVLTEYIRPSLVLTSGTLVSGHDSDSNLQPSSSFCESSLTFLLMRSCSAMACARFAPETLGITAVARTRTHAHTHTQHAARSGMRTRTYAHTHDTLQGGTAQWHGTNRLCTLVHTSRKSSASIPSLIHMPHCTCAE